MVQRWRFSLTEVVCIGVFMALAALTFRPPRIERITSFAGPAQINADLLGELVQRYGTKKNSQGPEELLIRDFFQDLRGGVFLDVGAYEPQVFSNTYFLERRLDWSGVAVDALVEFSDGYRQMRPRTRFVVAFASDRDGGTETIHFNPAGLGTTSSVKSFTRLFHGTTSARQVPVRTLNSILDGSDVRSIDFMNMDIELGEPAALRGFSVGRFRPRLVCIEAHGETRQAILDYFADNGYVLVGKYLPVDPTNLYFTPRATHAVPGL
jgi:FkbM family methyltransferase